MSRGKTRLVTSLRHGSNTHVTNDRFSALDRKIRRVAAACRIFIFTDMPTATHEKHMRDFLLVHTDSKQFVPPLLSETCHPPVVRVADSALAHPH